MSMLNKSHAETIAQKLKATYKEGGDHTLAILYVNGIRIGQFGIRRGKKSLGHDYIPKQIFFPAGQCLKLAQCTLNRPDWIKALQAQKIIPTAKPEAPTVSPVPKPRKLSRKK
jgi:hypothetical protein